MPLRNWLLGLFGRRGRQETGQPRHRGQATHVIILDGTLSSLRPGDETNAGLTYKLLSEAGRSANLTVYYEAGIQWDAWSDTLNVLMGRGINRKIERAYGVLASRYRPGDRIMLVGYSRGAYAVRSLAGVIDVLGLVRADCATERAIRTAYRHYRAGGDSDAAQAFRDSHCHDAVEIEAVAVWDTVKSLGVVAPLAWRLTEKSHAFHNDALGETTRHGFHALALNETRVAYAPVMWRTPVGRHNDVRQVWFRGSHGDVGGQLGGYHAARPLANIPLVWMLDRLAECDLPLPDGWRERFAQDVDAPSVGVWRGWGRLLMTRRKRVVGSDPSESLHASVRE